MTVSYDVAALEAWVQAHDRWLVGLDYDGTLVEIMDSPQAAVLPGARRAQLLALDAITGLRLVLVSGRSVGSLDEVSKLVELERIGLHGFEHALPGEAPKPAEGLDAGFVHRLQVARLRLEGRLQEIPGSWIESKVFALTLHTRGCTAEAERRAQTVFRKEFETLEGIALIPGKRVLEVRPAGTDKGTALRKMSDEDGGLPVFYAGDDTTDEDAFEALRDQNAFTIKVGQGPSGARYSVADVRALAQVLDDLLGLVQAVAG